MTTETRPTEVRYISTADTAKLIRAALKKAFGAQKFSVRSDSFAGGSAVDVRWVDGPTSEAVEDIILDYKGGEFDGSIDFGYSKDHWLTKDGRASIAYSPGSQGQQGSDHSLIGLPPTPDAELVRFSPHFVNGHREYSAAFLARVAEPILTEEGYLIPLGLQEHRDGTAYIKDSRGDLAEQVWRAACQTAG